MTRVLAHKILEALVLGLLVRLQVGVLLAVLHLAGIHAHLEVLVVLGAGRRHDALAGGVVLPELDILALFEEVILELIERSRHDEFVGLLFFCSQGRLMVPVTSQSEPYSKATNVGSVGWQYIAHQKVYISGGCLPLRLW